jgi:hypothetical protein
MKQLRNFGTFLLIPILLGFFANFAQNDYGLTLVKYSLLALSITHCILLVDSVKKLKGLIVLLFLSLFSITVTAGIDDVFIITSIFTAVILWFMPLIILVAERKAKERSDTLLYLDQYVLTLLSLAYFMKLSFLPGSSALLVFSMPYCLIHLLLLISRIFISIRQKTTLSDIPFFRAWMGILVTGSVFKMQHWPWANHFIAMALLAIPLMLIITLYRFKYRNAAPLILSSGYATRTLMVSFLLMSIYLFLGKIGMQPPFFYNTFPIESLEFAGVIVNEENPNKRNPEKEEIYMDNYYRFMQNIEDMQREEE